MNKYMKGILKLIGHRSHMTKKGAIRFFAKHEKDEGNRKWLRKLFGKKVKII
jgi:hypothetical protein